MCAYVTSMYVYRDASVNVVVLGVCGGVGPMAGVKLHEYIVKFTPAPDKKEELADKVRLMVLVLCVDLQL